MNRLAVVSQCGAGLRHERRDFGMEEKSWISALETVGDRRVLFLISYGMGPERKRHRARIGRVRYWTAEVLRFTKRLPQEVPADSVGQRALSDVSHVRAWSAEFCLDAEIGSGFVHCSIACYAVGFHHMF